MTIQEFEKIFQGEVGRLANKLESYCNEIAMTVEKQSETDILEYVDQTFQKIDNDFMSSATYVFEEFETSFNEDTDSELFTVITTTLEEVKDRIIEMKYNIMNLFAKAALA